MRMKLVITVIYYSTILGLLLGTHAQEILRKKRDADSIDFRNAYDDPETGLKCVNKESTIQKKEQERLLECVHSKINVCHYTYVTRFTSQRVEKCDDHYEKICRIIFKDLPTNETVKHCYRPMVKECRSKDENVDDDNLICKTVFETECSTRYVEKQSKDEKAPKKYVGLTACKKLPIELCGSQYCDFVPGDETCHNKTVTSIIPVPEESCDLVPQETCKGVYKLVPYLVPESQCKDVPREVCTYGVKSTRLGEKPIVTKWCYDPDEGTNPSEIVRTGGAREGSNSEVLKNFLSEEERSGVINTRRPLIEGISPPPINEILLNEGNIGKSPGDRFQLSNNERQQTTNPGDQFQFSNNGRQQPTTPENQFKLTNNDRQQPTNPGDRFQLSSNGRQQSNNPGDRFQLSNNGRQQSTNPGDQFKLSNNERQQPTNPGDQFQLSNNDRQQPANPGDQFKLSNNGPQQPTNPGDRFQLSNNNRQQPTNPGDRFQLSNNGLQKPTNPGDRFQLSNNGRQQPTNSRDQFQLSNNDQPQPNRPGDRFQLSNSGRQQPNIPGDRFKLSNNGRQQPNKPGDRFQLSDNGRPSRIPVREFNRINNANRNQVEVSTKTPYDPFSNVFTIISGSEEGAAQGGTQRPNSQPIFTQIPAFGNRQNNINNNRNRVSFGNKAINTQNTDGTILSTNGKDTATGPAPIPSEVEYFDQYEDFNVSPPIPTQETRPLNKSDEDTTPATTPKPFLFNGEGGVVGTASADVQNDFGLKFQVDQVSLKQFDEFLKEYEANYENVDNEQDDFPDYTNFGFNANNNNVNGRQYSSSNDAKDVFPRSTTPRRTFSTTPSYDTEFEFISNDEDISNEDLTTPLPSLSPGAVSRRRAPKRNGNRVFRNNQNIPDNFEPLLDVAGSQDENSVQISEAASVQDLSKVSKSSFARVIKHNDSESSIGQTIIVRNTPEAIKLFGIKNIPKDFLLRSSGVNNFKIVNIDNKTRDAEIDYGFLSSKTTDEPLPSSTTTTTTAKPTTPTPSPSTFSDVFFTHTATTTPVPPRIISSQVLDAQNSFSSFSSLLGIEEAEFPFKDRVDRNVKDLPLIHFTTSRPTVLNSNPTSAISFTTEKVPLSSLGQLLRTKNLGSTTTPNPFITRETTISISRGTPSWERSTTEAKITLKPTQLVVNQTPSDSRVPKTITFIRNPSITAIQDFATPENSLQNQDVKVKSEVTRQILDIGFQNTVKKHQSIIKPSNLVSSQSNTIRASRNPSQYFKAPPTLIYGFKPMTTPLVRNIQFPSTPPPPPPPSSKPRQFSPPSNLHFGFRPMNENVRESEIIIPRRKQPLNPDSNHFKGSQSNFKELNDNLRQNNQVKRNVGGSLKNNEDSSSSSSSVLDTIKDFLTTPFKKIIDNF
ncbi:uncharacterized protein [Lepeophtheirus salmonis]|uniref:uncharacterized protein n=1 Tax=Lepeophtheirus salmonis TaxID=72036 RepID=UPI001AE1CACF|nr:probable serine/threonine-protein kinase DDB_G0282963 [Lepeophtheirus salmonis]